MTRPWGPTGGTKWEPVTFSPSDTERIRIEMKSLNVPLNSFDQFIAAIEEAVTRFRSNRDIAAQCKPADVRDNLQKALDAAIELDRRLRALDGNSLRLLRQVVSTGARALNASTLRTKVYLRDALRLADEYPQRGRLPDYARRLLAADVATAIAGTLGIEPTTTKESLYPSMLAIALEIATGTQAKEVHALAAQGMKAYRSDRD